MTAPMPPPANMSAGSAAAPAMPSAVTMSGLGGPAGGRGGVPLSVPLPFLLSGVCGAALFGMLLPWIAPDALLAPDVPHVLALVHVATLGWLTMIILGAMLQLAPVILVTPLRAVGPARGVYPIYVTGVGLLVGGFWWARPWLMALGGSLVVLAVISYAVVLGITMMRASRRPLAARYLVAALGYLCIVLGLGLTAALNFQLDFLGAYMDRLLLAHITLAVVGWLSTTLIGVSYQLVRLFALAHGHDDRLGRLVFLLLNAGLVTLALAFSFGWLPVVLIGGAALLAAIWLFVYDYVRMLRARRRRVLDVTQRHGIAAVGYLAVVMPLALAASVWGWGRAVPAGMLAALGLMALVGWLGQSTIGYLYKIVPFLVWNARYGELVGKQKVPLMRDLVHARWAEASWWLINIGLPAAALCLALGWVWPLRLAGATLGAGLVLAAANVVGVAAVARRKS